MEFVPLYYAERLRVVNPTGDVGIATLWSKVESVIEVLESSGVDLSPETSRIVVVANLYGNGLPHMLRNLLHNPQIHYIVICGKNLSGSREWLLNFFAHGLEEVMFLGAKSFRIIGTERIIDGEVRREDFSNPPQISVFGEISSNETKVGIKTFLETLPPKIGDEIIRIDPPEVPQPAVTRFPSNAFGHQILRERPTEAWRELIFRLYRFGHRTTITKSSGPEQRIELPNVRVVVEDPSEESKEIVSSAGFSLERFRDYQKRILDPIKPADLDYSYGSLLRMGLDKKPIDSLEIIADRMTSNPDTRSAFATLWNNAIHLPMGRDLPCFVTFFFRRFEEKLTMTATFRAHNAMDAWLENFYGLAAIQRFVTERSGLERGPITVISHSISIDPNALSRAKSIVDDKKTDEILDKSTGKLGPRFDPNGAFTVTIDRSTLELVVEHSFQGMKLGEYRGRTVEEIEHQLSRDEVLSVFSHALYLGRELARKEMELKVLKK